MLCHTCRSSKLYCAKWFFLSLLELDAEGDAAGMVRGAVGPVDGRIGTAGHGAAVEKEGLVRQIHAHRLFRQNPFSRSSARNQAEEVPAFVTENADADRYHIHIVVGKGRIEVEIGNGGVRPDIAGSKGHVP